MLDINWSDVMNIINLITPYLIAIAAAIVLGIIITVAVMKVKEPKKYLIRSIQTQAMMMRQGCSAGSRIPMCLSQDSEAMERPY